MTDEEPRIPATTHTFRKFVVLAVAVMALLILLLLMLGRVPRLAAPEPDATATRRPTTVAQADEPATDTPLPATPTALPPTNTPPPTETEAPPTASETPPPAPASEVGTPPRPATLTATPLPPTVTPTRVPSNTPLPPSPTATGLPSATPVPPTARPTATATSLPPTATATAVTPASAPLRIDTPVAGASVPQGRLEISGVAGPGTQVQVIDGGEVVATTNANSGGSWTVVLGQGLEPGSHELRAEAIDANGEVEARSGPVPLTVVEMVVPTSGSDQLPWSAMLLVAAALAGLALVFVLAGATLNAWERTRRH